MLGCPSCGFDNPVGMRFCGGCGAKLGLRCDQCGASWPPGLRFCGNCGGRLEPSTDPSSPGPATTTGTATPPVAERRVCSVLFADLVGFTPLAESRDPEEVRELLSEYFDGARTVITRYGGLVEKFIGDAVMAVWGTPSVTEDDAERAVRAGLDLVAAVAALGEHVRADGLALRVGIVTGDVAVTLGAVGEGMVAGDAVNTAARMQAVAEAGTVLVDERTRGLTRSAIGYAEAGTHALKGKAAAVPLFRAVRVVAAVGGAQRVDGLEASFLGRDRELRTVKDCFHASTDGGGARLLAISGPAGVGKSRLSWEFFKYLDGLSATALWHSGRALSYGEGVAFWALAEMVRQRIGSAEEESPTAAAGKLAAALERWIADPAEREFLTPRLGALLGLAEPGLSREELFAGWRTFFVRLAESSPVVLVVEDAEHADPGLLDFLDHLLDWAADAPIFLVTLARPDLVDRRPGWGAHRRTASTLPLDPLPPAVMAALLDELVFGLPAQVRDLIVARADGVPLYAVELVRSLIDRDVVVPEGGVYRLIGEVGELAPPASLAALVAARIDALPEAERTLVRDLAVLGGTFPRAAVAALCSLSPAATDDLLASLVRKEVLSIRADRLSPERGQYAFTQGLLRSVAYDTLGRRDRKSRHLAVAAHLRATFPGDGEEVAEVIAAHYADAYRAGPDDADTAEIRAEALAAYRRGGARALTVGAPETALALYGTAAELAVDQQERADLVALAGKAALNAGQSEVAATLLGDALAAHRDCGRDREAAALAFHLGWALSDANRIEDAIACVRAALASVEDGHPDPDAARLSGALAMGLVFTGAADEAVGHIDRALVYAQALDLPDVLSLALDGLALLRSGAGRHAEALIGFEAAAEVADRHGLLFEAEAAHGNAGDARMTGDLPGARERFETSLGLARRRGDRFREASVLCNLMLIDLFAGRWADVEQMGNDALADPARPGAAHMHNRLALLAAMRGEAERAESHRAELAGWLCGDNLQLRSMAVAANVSVTVAGGDMALALVAGRGLLHDAASLGPRHEVVRQAWPDAVEAALRLGDLAEADGLLALLTAHPPGHVPPYLRAQHARFRAMIAAARAEHSAVEADFSTAEDILAGLGYPYWLARTRLDHATWLNEQGRTTAAGELAQQAGVAFAELGAAPALAGARAFAATAAR